MTTIAYRAGIMAADSRAFAGDKMPIGSKNKLHVLSNGALVAASSNDVGATDSFASWCRAMVDAGEDLPNMSTGSDYGVQALLVWIDGTVHYWHEGRCFSGPLEGEFFAIGSGEQFAYGAMMAGVSAEQAVRAACVCDPWTDFPVRTARLEPAPSPAPRKKSKPKKRKKADA